MAQPMHRFTPSALPLRSAKQPYLSKHASGKKQEDSPLTPPSAAAGPSTFSGTTLGQRFRRAIQHGDLAAAQRTAARAFELQLSPSPPSPYDTHAEHADQHSFNAPKAALRAAQAQRPSSEHPFDVRNVELVPERIGLTKHNHHRKYSLAILDDALEESPSSADPSLVIAIRSNADVELVRWLIDMGHEREATSVDADGNTVVHLATLYDRSDIIYAYSTYNSNHVASSLADLIDAEQSHERRTALHLACIRGFDDVARQLLDLGADVDLQDRAGNTALHFASAWGHLSLVQLLIERGCSLAVKNAEGSTPSDYAYSHSVKDALETLGRMRYESRKKTRRVPVATVMPAPVRPSMSIHAGASEDSFASEKQSRSRPFPSLLGRSGSNGGAHRGRTTPIRSTFDSGDQTAELYDDWDPEKTFAQPGQDLKRGVFSSPSGQQGDGSMVFSTPSRASIDPYSETLDQSQASVGTAAPVISYDRTGSPQPRPAPPSGPTRQEDTMAHWQAMASLGDIKRSLSPNLGPNIRRTSSPGHAAASADKVRMQDAAAMSLFRSTTPQPGVPGRIDTPPIASLRSENLLQMGSRKGGVKSPPPGKDRSASISTTSDSGEQSGTLHGIRDGPPLLAPVATLPALAQDVGDESNRRE